jgi:hypothetical protein
MCSGRKVCVGCGRNRKGARFGRRAPAPIQSFGSLVDARSSSQPSTSQSFQTLGELRCSASLKLIGNFAFSSKRPRCTLQYRMPSAFSPLWSTISLPVMRRLQRMEPCARLGLPAERGSLTCLPEVAIRTWRTHALHNTEDGASRQQTPSRASISRALRSHRSHKLRGLRRLKCVRMP